MLHEMSDTGEIASIFHEHDPKWHVVSRKKSGQMFYPRSIPRKRKKFNIILTIVPGLVFFIGAATVSDLCFTLVGIGYGVLAQIFVEMVYRTILILKEFWFHFTSRHNNCYQSLVNHIFHFPTESYVFFSLSLFIFVVSYNEHGIIDVTKHKSISLFCIFCGLLLLRKIMGIEKAPIYDSLRVAEDCGLDYGSAMAHSYFYGYLNIILKKSGSEDKNLVELIENYSDSNKIQFPVPKLFVLIPKSCICHVSLKDPKFPDIEDCASLNAILQSVAGVKDRAYGNPVYKITNKKNKSVYVCAEFATPLQRLKERIDFGGRHGVYLKQQKEEIVLQFYLTVLDLLNHHPEIRDLCVLIYYDDMDKAGQFRDLSQIILYQIKKFKTKTRKSKRKF